jgi:tetratricopeptide (TPR) repeat protein
MNAKESHKGPSRSILLAFLFALAASTATAAADTAGQKPYQEGIRAFELGDYDVAARKLRDAIDLDEEEGLRKFRTTGLKFEDYLPHYYLGLTLGKLGQPRAALSELKESEHQGAVRGNAKRHKTLIDTIRILEATRRLKSTRSNV